MDRRKLAALAFLAVVANGAAIFYTAHVTRGEEPVIPPPGQAFVQFGGVPFQGEEYSDVALPTERDEIRKLEKIGQLIAESRFSDAAILLDRVLLKEEDSFFVPGEDKTNFRSLKSEAARLIGTLPAKGIEAYRLQFGTLAAKALAEAVPTGDVAALTEISRRYFHTLAGHDATFILARHHLDHDRPMAAAMCYQQLLDAPQAAARFEPTLSVLAAISWSRAGMERRAEQTLTRLKRRDPDAQLQIADRSVGLFARGTDSLAWLSRTVGRQLPSGPRRQNEWTTFRGDASRNGESAGGRPLLAPRWRVRIANHPAVEKAVKRIQQSYTSQGIASLPSLHPLAVGDVILTRTARQLIAVDFKTGKRVWEELSNRDNIFEGLADSGQRQSPSSRDLRLDAQLQRRLWGNVPYGTLSSDGQRVFVIQDFGFIADRSNPRFNIMPGRQRFRVSPQGMSNRLSAFELRTEGKFLWEIGGADSEIKELQDAFFLGPPLVLSGALHALVEIRGGIRLVVLEPQTDSATGRETVKLIWSQQLADVEETIDQDSTRRLAGATPSYADGVLVCPTSAGAVVAVDLARRSLLWAYKYPPLPGNGIRGRRGMRGLGRATGKANDRWVDATATLVDGRVLLTPVESGEIHCLDLLDGKLLWKQKRGENLYVAQVYEGKVILVGHRSMTALALADGGKAVWSPSEMTLPDGSMPSGRGFSSGNHYYLPLTSAEVAKIDVNQGVIVDRAKSRDGIVPGNLICFRDEVISLSAESLDTFFQIEPLRERVAAALLDNPNDAEALARMGEIEFDRGELTSAIDNFQRSFDLDPNSLTRELLVQSLLMAIKSDFTANRDAAEQLEALIDQPEQRVMLLRLIAAGQQKSYQRLDAFESYLKLVDMDLDEAELFKIGPHLTVRSDRHIQAQLVELHRAATPDERALMDHEIGARLAALGEEATIGDLYGFLSYFGGNSAAEVARLNLAEKLLEGDSPLECEMLLRQLSRSNDMQHRRAAVAMMAELLRGAGRPEHAAVYYRLLAGQFSQDVSLRGRTGEEIFASLPKEDPVRTAMEPPKSWPTGKVTATKPTSRAAKQRSGQTINVALRGQRGPFFAQTFVTLDPRAQLIVGRDGLGKEEFRASLRGSTSDRMSQVRRTSSSSNYTYALTSGHLMLVSLGANVVALDTLSGRGNRQEKVLWREDLVGRIPGDQQFNSRILMKKNPVPGGRPQMRAIDANQRTVGVLGPITENGVAFQSQGDLKCVDPLTGALLWSRGDIPLGCELFGDDEVLLVVPPGATEAQVFRMRDGDRLGTCRVPAEGQRMAILGRRILQVSAAPRQKKYELKLVDPWKKAEIWSRSFASTPRTWILDDEVIGAMLPSGKFMMLSLADGQVLIDEQLEPEPVLSTIFLMRSSDQYFLITNGQAQRRINSRRVIPVPSNSTTPLISGHVYAFDRRTFKPLWPGPAVIEQRAISLTQPSDLPVLTFVQQVMQTGNQSQRKRITTVLCLDKRTGRKLYAGEFPISGNPYRLFGDPTEKTVSFVMTTSAVKLKFSDEPVAPAPPYQGHLDGTGGRRRSRTMFDIFGDAAQRGRAARDAERAARRAERAARDAQRDARPNGPGE